MFYFYGNEEFLIEKNIKSILEKYPNHLVLKFGAEIKINEAINQISTFSLFESSKIVVFENFLYLNKCNENEAQSIIHALKFKPETTIVIFTSEDINEKTNKNSLFKFLKKNANCVHCNELSDKEISSFVKEKIAELGGTISDIDLYYLLSKLPNKLTLIMNEIEKLILLDNNISRTNIDNLVQKYDLGSAFDFINAFIDLDGEEIFKTYYEKINQGETIVNLMNQIINSLELASKIYSLKKVGLTNKEIENKLNKHAFVIKKTNDFLNTLGYKKINSYLDSLAQIDTNVKMGKIDEKIAFERFLLEIIKD